MSMEQLLQFLGTAAVVLGSTWKLSGQISAISTKLDEHIKSDADRFRVVETDLDTIAPRAVRLRQRGN